jgi:hypothetical protein
MEIVLAIHSVVRWVILLVALVALVKLGLGWQQKGAFDGMDRGVVMGYSGLLDLQALLGLVLLFGNGFFFGEGFPLPRILHSIVMLLAVAAGHLPSLWKNSPAVTRYRMSLAAIAGSLALVVVGIIIIAVGQGS